MAQHRKTRQKQIQTSASALTYDVVRFLKVPRIGQRDWRKSGRQATRKIKCSRTRLGARCAPSREREYQVVYPYAKPARSSKQDCVATLRFAMGSCAYAADVLSVARGQNGGSLKNTVFREYFTERLAL
jgi:hypothetical protein